MTFSIKNFFSKCDQILRKLRIWLHLLNKSLMENFIFLFQPFKYIQTLFYLKWKFSLSINCMTFLNGQCFSCTTTGKREWESKILFSRSQAVGHLQTACTSKMCIHNFLNNLRNDLWICGLWVFSLFFKDGHVKNLDDNLSWIDHI